MPACYNIGVERSGSPPALADYRVKNNERNEVANSLPDKIDKQISKAGLPRSGSDPFVPQLQLDKDRKSRERKASVKFGPRKGKKGYVDIKGRIWVKDRAHGNYPDHWDVQEDDGRSYVRIDLNGNPLP